jgi:murein DD-endopeptidase MepM/ murein hydrolase activator NlpD
MTPRRFAVSVAVVALAGGCVAPSSPPEDVAVVQPVERHAPNPAPAQDAAPRGPTTFTYTGALIQGGWIRGEAPAGTVRAWLGETPLTLDAGHFFAAFDRDAVPSVTLRAELADGRSIASPLTIAARAWNIERVNVARAPGGATDAFMRIRRPELERIAAARAVNADAAGWQQQFVWPAKGRISGRFGSQRIYRGGEAGAYHSGLDIATGGSGAIYVAPADGLVTLAAETPFSLEGNLLILDHGQGLNSAFLHSSALLVREGDRVAQGQPIGRIGMTGRATGPHLHWSLIWQGFRLDPLLFVGEQ